MVHQADSRQRPHAGTFFHSAPVLPPRVPTRLRAPPPQAQSAPRPLARIVHAPFPSIPSRRPVPTNHALSPHLSSVSRETLVSGGAPRPRTAPSTTPSPNHTSMAPTSLPDSHPAVLSTSPNDQAAPTKLPATQRSTRRHLFITYHLLVSSVASRHVKTGSGGNMGTLTNCAAQGPQFAVCLLTAEK